MSRFPSWRRASAVAGGERMTIATVRPTLPCRLLAFGRGFGFHLRRRAGLGPLDLFEGEKHLILGESFGADMIRFVRSRRQLG